MAGVHAIAGAKRGLATTINVVPSTYYSERDISSIPAIASVTFNTDGTVTKNADSGGTYNWGVGSAFLSSDYSIKFETSSGTLSSGTADSYLSLSSARTFGVSRSTIGNKDWVGTVRIRRNSDSVEMDSAAVTLSALVTS